MTAYDYIAFDNGSSNPGLPLSYNEASTPVDWAAWGGPTQRTPFGLHVVQRDLWWNLFAGLHAEYTIVESFFPDGITFDLDLNRAFRRVGGVVNTATVTESDLYLPGPGTGLVGPTEFYGTSGSPAPNAVVLTLRVGFFGNINPFISAHGLYVDGSEIWHPSISISGTVQFYDALGAPDHGFNIESDFSALTGSDPVPAYTHGYASFCAGHGGGDMPLTLFIETNPPDFSIDMTVTPNVFYSWGGLYDTTTGLPL